MPRYEKIKLISGTPKEVQEKLNKHFGPDTHPNATLVSTAVSVHIRDVVDEEEVERRASEKAKSAKKAKPAESEGSGEPAAVELVSYGDTPMKTVREEFMVATVANVFP